MSNSGVKVVLNSAGVRELLKSQEMQAICNQHANAALAKLGDGYEVTSMVGRNRCNSEIAAVGRRAKEENNKNNTILKAVQSS